MLIVAENVPPVAIDRPPISQVVCRMADLTQQYDEAGRLHESGDTEGAISKLEEIVESDDSFALAHNALAVYYGKVGKHEDAVRHAQRVCELEPDDPFSFTAMSVVFQRAFAGTGDHQFIALAEEAMARSQMLQGRG